MEVDFYLRSRAAYIDGHKTEVDVRLIRRLNQPDALVVGDRVIDPPWTLRLHCPDGTVQTIARVEGL